MNNFPLEPRIGSAGTGLWVGCGAGVGLLTPVSLHSIPVLGQVVSSFSHSLNRIDTSFLRFLQPVRGALRRTTGMDAGFGCGVAVGYGWGAGLMLTPTAGAMIKGKVEGLMKGLKENVPMLERLEQQQKYRQEGVGGGESSGGGGSDFSSVQGAMHTGNNSNTSIDTVHQQYQQNIVTLEQQVSELTTLLQSQGQVLAELQKHVSTLQNALLEENMNTKKNKGRR